MTFSISHRSQVVVSNIAHTDFIAVRGKLEFALTGQRRPGHHIVTPGHACIYGPHLLVQ